MTKTKEQIPGLEPGMKTKGITAGYAHPWPKGLPTPACADTGYDPDWWFPTDAATRRVAARICATECALADLCRQVAATRGEYGVWGGVLFDNGHPIEQPFPEKVGAGAAA